MTVRSAATTAEAPSALVGSLTFTEGLFGFPECRRFVLTSAPRNGFYWLRSLEHEPLAFLLADPFLFFHDYSVELGDADLAGLGATCAADVAVLCIVTLPRDPGDLLTANLQGPLVANLARGVARQIILPDSTFGLRAPFVVGAADAA